MRKNLLLLLCSWLLSFSCAAQTDIYEFIDLGKYQIGYQDTMLFDSAFHYKAYGYNGPKPQFLQIWFPVSDPITNTSFLRFGEFFHADKQDALTGVREALNKHFTEAIIRDCLDENLLTGDSAEFGSYSREDIVKQICELPTRSIRMKYSGELNFPVIVYHHGSQSFSFENHLMAEYFASRGFVFIAAGFHLPYENKSFGLIPFDRIIKGEEEENLKSIMKFARKTSAHSSVFYIGHSWGAQMGFRTLDADSTLTGFVSLETTLEFKEDFARINELWPEVYNKIIVEKAHYSFPIMLSSATGKEQPFLFFENLKAPYRLFCSTKKEFEHNAYTSVFYLRYFLENKIPQSDRAILPDRLVIYKKHLEIISDFIAQSMQHKSRSGVELKFVK